MPSHIFSVQTVGGTVKDSSALPIALSQAMHEMTAVQEGIEGWPCRDRHQHSGFGQGSQVIS